MVLKLHNPADLTLLQPEVPAPSSHLHSETLLLLPQAAVGPQQTLEVLPHPDTLLQVRGPQPGG